MLRSFTHYRNKLHVDNMTDDNSVQWHRVSTRFTDGTSTLPDNILVYAISIDTYHGILRPGHLPDFLRYRH